jgi:UDP-3-O-[3-hydroxymyristoyl] glucosamine N-acyltransferase
MSDPVFFTPSRRFNAGEIAALTGATLATPELARNEVAFLTPADSGRAGALVFVEGRRNAGLMAGVKASVVVCSEDLAGTAPAGVAVIVSRHPHRDFSTVGRLLFPASVRPGPLTGETGVSAAAHVHPLARVEPGAVVEAFAVIGPEAEVGSGTVVAPHAVIGPSCRIGRDGYVGPAPRSSTHFSATASSSMPACASARTASATCLAAPASTRCPSSAASSSRTTSRSAPTPRSIAARFPIR